MADISKEQQDAILFIESLEVAFKLGRNDGLDEAIRIARSATYNAGDEYGHGYNKAAAEITRAIESLKDNTP